MLVHLCHTILVKWTILYERLGLKYCIPFVLLLLYTMFGACIFYVCEGEHDQRIRNLLVEKYNVGSLQLMERLVELSWIENYTYIEIYNHTLDAVTWYHNYLGIDVYLGERMGESPWTWWGSMFYAGTLYTTIGYGRPSPRTSFGRVLTCIYSLIGIPLFLVILKEVGKVLCRLLCHIWKRAKKSWKKMSSKRKFSNLSLPQKNGSVLKLQVVDGDVEDPANMQISGDNESDRDSSEPESHSKIPFPVALPLGVLVLWIFGSAGVFLLWERSWDYWTAVYFFVISLTTVGLGDVVPTEPALMLANFTLILIGLALLSMCFNIVQIRLEELLDDMLQQFIHDFDKVANVVQHKPFRYGIEDAFMSNLPLHNISGKKWLNVHLARILSKKRRAKGNESADEDVIDDEVKGEVLNTVQIWTNMQKGKSGVKNKLLTRVMGSNKTKQLQDMIRKRVTSCSTSTQTDNEFSDLIKFLDIPKNAENPTRKVSTISNRSDMDMISMRSSILSMGDWMAFCDLNLREAVEEDNATLICEAIEPVYDLHSLRELVVTTASSLSHDSSNASIQTIDTLREDESQNLLIPEDEQKHNAESTN